MNVENASANQLHCYEGRVQGRGSGSAIALGKITSYACMVLSVMHPKRHG